MTGTIRATANDILNQVGVEIGLDPVADPFASTDQTYRQMSYLINTAGEELCQAYPWEVLRKQATVVTDGVNHIYSLPSDFLYMLDQTQWDQTETCPLYGPLSAQDWSYLIGSNTISGLDGLGYRLMEDKLALHPVPPPAGRTIAFEYISRNWVLDSSTGTTYIDKVKIGGDRPQFNRTLLGRMLKVKILEAKGFDTSKAQADLNQAFQLLVARNKSAPILNTARSRGNPYLSDSNIPDTGYGT